MSSLLKEEGEELQKSETEEEVEEEPPQANRFATLTRQHQRIETKPSLCKIQ